MRRLKPFCAALFALVLLGGCHEADEVLYPVSQVSEELNATVTHFTLPIKGLPFSDIHFNHRSLVLEKKF